MIVKPVLLATLLTVILTLKNIQSKQCGYDSCYGGKENFINVHLIAHSHDDVGWLKTVDQYYYGGLNYIQVASVEYILDTVVQALHINSSRKFTYVEMAFFLRWWRRQSIKIREIVQKLVQNGQLQFSLGAWSMADEAVVYYGDAVEQMTLGNDLLKRLFGECGIPRVAWQIDPFGHSRDHADLFINSGYDGVFFQRMDYQEKDLRRELKRMEILWDTGNVMNNEHEGLFTSMFYDSYCHPRSFCFDDKCNDPPMQDDLRLKDYNIPDRVALFLEYVKKVKQKFATNHILIPMGCDFTYENAFKNFKNLDKLIQYVNAEQINGSEFHLFYSTPQCYVKAVNEAFNKQGHMHRRGGDFFPYASGPNSLWTGYYTSRPALKGSVRQASTLLTMCEHLHLFSNHIKTDGGTGYTQKSTDKLVDELRQMMGVMQHHDAVTGTEKQHVANDYIQSLHSACKSCQRIISNATYRLLPDLHQITGGEPVLFCDLLNISRCEATEASMPYVDNSKYDGIFISFYNPNGWELWTKWLRIPVYVPDLKPDSIEVTLRDFRRMNLDNLPFQLVPVSERTLTIPERKTSSSQRTANMEILFNIAALGPPATPTGFTLLYLRLNKKRKDNLHTGQTNADSIGTLNSNVAEKRCSEVIKPSLTTRFRLTLDDTDDPLTIVAEHILSGMQLKLKIEMLYYLGETNAYQNSGAYIFVPTMGSNIQSFGKPTVKVINGSCVQEVHLFYSTWATLKVALYANGEMEVEWTAGPLPDYPGPSGREVVVRYTVEGNTILPKVPGEFFTDSAGRRLIRRVRNERIDWNLTPGAFKETQPISGNYYPIVNRIMLKGTGTSDQPAMGFAVYTDRAQGGTSLQDGQIEIMVHRRCREDDHFGVSERLLENGVDGQGLIVRGIHQIRLDELHIIENEDAKLSRLVSKPPILSFIPKLKNHHLPESERMSPHKLNPTIMSIALNFALPAKLHLLSLSAWPLERTYVPPAEPDRILIRLEHIGSNEAKDGEKSISLDLAHLLRGVRVTNYEEVILTATKEKSISEDERLSWPTQLMRNKTSHQPGYKKNVTVLIDPGTISTFLLDFENLY